MEVDRRSYSHSRTERERTESSSRVSSKSSRNPKRSYQRDNRRRGSYDDQTSAGSPSDDLRSPCHKQPRFKGQKENAHNDEKTPVNHRWSKNRISGSDVPSKKSPLALCNKEFPPLGFNTDEFTPEANKDWGAIVEEEENKRTQSEGRKQSLKFKRKLLLSESKDSDAKDKTKPNSNTKPTTAVPRVIITDPHKLDQRQKQIDIGKNTVAYGRFIGDMSREKRQKEDPWTPDKFQQCSTRSWVGQIKVWRRRLHTWDPPSSSQDDLFSSSSTSSSQDPDTRMEVEEPPRTKSSRSSSSDDLFSGFDIDACLMDDGFPL